MRQMTSDILKEIIPNVILHIEFKNKWKSHFGEVSEKESDVVEVSKFLFSKLIFHFPCIIIIPNSLLCRVIKY